MTRTSERGRGGGEGGLVAKKQASKGGAVRGSEFGGAGTSKRAAATAATLPARGARRGPLLEGGVPVPERGGVVALGTVALL